MNYNLPVIGTGPNRSVSVEEHNAAVNEAIAEAVAAAPQQPSPIAGGRPGQQMRAFVTAAVGAPADLTAIEGQASITSANIAGLGAVARVDNAPAIIATREALAVQSGRVYRVHAYVRRLADGADPAGNSVVLQLARLNAAYGLIGSTTIDARVLRVSDGLWHLTGTVAVNPGALPEVGYELPEGTVYVRPYVQVFTADHQTAVAQVEVIDITEAAQIEGGLDVVAVGQAVAIAEAEAAAAAADREIAQLSADLALTFGPRTKDSRAALLADTALTSANTPVGATVNVRGVGDFLRVAAGGDLTTAGLLRFSAATTALTPEMFASIEDAIEVAAETERALVGTPGSTYVFQRPARVLGAHPVKMIMEGCELVRSASMVNDRVLLIDHPMSATTYAEASTIVGWSMVEYNFGNGPVSVPRLEMTSTAGYAVKDIVKALSLDIIPSFPSQPGGTIWMFMRHAEIAEIGAIVGNFIYLIRPFAEAWTPTKLVRLTNKPVILRGGEWYDEPGYPIGRNQPMVELRGCVRPDYRGMRFRDTASTQLAVNSCYEPKSFLNIFDRPRHLPASTAYGYGEKIGGGTTRPMQMLGSGTSCRHVWDTIGSDILDESVATTHPRQWGGTINPHVKGTIGFDCLNSPISTHTDAVGSLIEDCASYFTNRRSPGATLSGLHLRGRGDLAKGGFYSGLNPVLIQQATRVPTVLEQVTLEKIAVTTHNVDLEPLVHIDGTQIVGGGRGRVELRDMSLKQDKGRKELILAKNAEVIFSGSAKVNTDLTVTPLIALDNSEVTFLDTVADFSEATNNQSTLVSLRSAGCAVYQAGRVAMRAPSAFAGDAQIVLVSFAPNGSATPFEAVVRLHDVVVNDTLFGSGSGLRFPPAALNAQIGVRRSDTGAVPSDVTANFSTSSGAKPISWPIATAHPVIFAAINATTTGTFVGTIPNGAFVGQRLMLTNVGGFSFEIQTAGNISVGATRTVAVGATHVLRWNGTAWAG